MMIKEEKMMMEEETKQLAQYGTFRTTDTRLVRFLVDMGMNFSVIRGEYVFLAKPELEKYVRIASALKLA